jgi:hypothetical protein
MFAAMLRAQRPMILCAAQPENNAREIANTRRADSTERFVAAVLTMTKLC